MRRPLVLLAMLLAVPALTAAPYRIKRLAPKAAAQIVNEYPGLAGKPWALLDYKVNGMYNCYAWSIGVVTREVGDKEISGADRTPTLAEWDAFYRKYGYGEPSTQKLPGSAVVLYSTDDKPQHAALKTAIVTDGHDMYISKLGRTGLMMHPLDGLEGSPYGKVIRTYRVVEPALVPPEPEIPPDAF